ncbi:MAG: aminotransferase class V-fold PLP-dependent enzyme, partial [Pseudomonadota bacterium]
MRRFLEDVARHGNMRLSDEEEVGLFAPLRESAAALLNAAPEQIAIVGSAGEMLSQLPYLFAPPDGARIIALASDFPAITRPWIAYAEGREIDLVFVEEDPARDPTDALIEGIDGRAAVVLASHVQFSTGSILDCARLRRAADAAGARLVIDVTQSAGAVPIEAGAWAADALVCSGYKWLGGHGGVGLAVLAPDLVAATPPAPGWMGAADPFDMQATRMPLAPDARRYTQSTMSYISIVGLGAAIGELLRLTPAAIQRHGKRLSADLYSRLDGSGWTRFRPASDPAASSHILALSHPAAEPEATLRALREARITCSLRNGRVRVSLAHFNDGNDVRMVADALQRSVSAR